MSYPIEKKFVIAVSSSALFDMQESNKIFKEKGETEYRLYQEQNIDKPFDKGVAFPFISRLLHLNEAFIEEQPIEIILLSKNSPESGLRAMRTIAYYGLNITRACFSSGRSNFQYLPAFNASLFLSDDPEATREAVEKGYAAGTILHGEVQDDMNDKELRLAFDFDGVIADDSSEKYLKEKKENLQAYMQHEKEYSNSPLAKGPIANLLQKISFFQKLEKRKERNDNSYKRMLYTSIVTARNAPAHERVVTTLKSMDIEVDEVFFLGGINKNNILKILKPHIFFDDQMPNLSELDVPAVHIPFGIRNTNE